MTTTFQMRIDSGVKAKAQKAFSKAGVDLSTGVRLYLNDIARRGNVEIRTSNGFTPAQEQAIIRETEWALKHGKRYDSVDEMHRDIMNDPD